MKKCFLILIFLTSIFLVFNQIQAQSIFYEAQPLAEVENEQINEASGLAASLNNPNMLWTHNDSGDKARVFLIDQKGNYKKEFILEGIENRDWEDIATGSGPNEKSNYLYIADIGDNRSVYPTKYIHRLIEPTIDDNASITEFETITFEFPDGIRDAESMFVDPFTNDIYILSKREKNISIYRAKYPQSVVQTITLEKLGNLPHFNTVAADISFDGTELLTKTYDKIFYWERKKDESIQEMLLKLPIEVEYKREPQGEAIAWKKDGSGFFTLSEEPDGIEAILYFYKKKE